MHVFSLNFRKTHNSVSYTHLDVYKRQVLEDLERARREYEAARLDTLTREEQAAYQALSQKIQTHIQTVLQ